MPANDGVNVHRGSRGDDGVRRDPGCVDDFRRVGQVIGFFDNHPGPDTKVAAADTDLCVIRRHRRLFCGSFGHKLPIDFDRLSRRFLDRKVIADTCLRGSAHALV